MKKNDIFICVLLFLFVTICSYRIVDVCILKSEYYSNLYDSFTNRYFRGYSAPRGRILDVNGKVLVDNVGVNTVVYNRTKGSSLKKEVDIAYQLGKILKFDENRFSEYKLKLFYLVIHDDCDYLITKEEWDLYNKRKLNSNDIESLKYERITESMLSEMSYEDKNASYIYYLLSNGYYFDDKVIKKGLTDLEVVRIKELDLPGISVVLTWERFYPYKGVLRTLLGAVSTNGVPLELKDHYLDKGVSLNSTVGISYLELQYDEYLRGKDALYKLNEAGVPELVEQEKQGNDLFLSIDIDKQLEIENILKKEMLNAKKAKNTEYYNHSYIIVGHPKTAEIVAVVGLQLNGDHFVDISANIINSSYTVGSIVKGATMSVGYSQDIIQKGKKILDSCVKVYGVTQKCSWTSLGYIDDIRAMAQSSNYYQFMIATKLTNPSYRWNSKLGATKEHFDIYRLMLSSYGLGVKTGIDLPREYTGIIGKTISDDLLLNLTIGQYDTYTPIEVFQYINTLANSGVRLAPSLMKKIVNSEGEILLENKGEVLNKVELDDEDMSRVQQGLREVMRSGTGRNYSTGIVSSAGKTGTSETFVDTNGNGVMDTKTISTAFIMYAPFENPEYSIAILSPNISRSNGGSSYKYSLNLRVNRKIMQYLFEKS